MGISGIQPLYKNMSEEQIVTTEEKDWKAEAEKLATEKENLNKALHEARSKSKEKETPDVASLTEQILKEVRMETRKATIDSQLTDLADEDRAKVKGALGRINYDSSSDEDTLKAVSEARLLALGTSEAEKKARKSIAEKSAMTGSSVNVTSAPTDDDEPELTETERKFMAQIKPYTK